MAEKQSQQSTERKLVNPFNVSYEPVLTVFDPEQRYVYRVDKVKVDKETLVTEPVFEKIDLQAEIDACKGLCGLEYMKMQLARGLAKPEDFYDDGQHGANLLTLPSDAHLARKISDNLSTGLASLAEMIGISKDEELTPQLFEERFKQFIVKSWNEAHQSEGGSK